MSKRLIALIFLGLMLIPAYYYGQSYVRATVLFPGDELIVKTCRVCDGDGKSMDMDVPSPDGRCMFCRGKGEVQVILPGPNRPTKIYGTVIDTDVVDEVMFVDVPPTSIGWLFSDLYGGVSKAEVVFTARGSGETHEVVSNVKGRFLIELKPADYDVTVSAAGFELGEAELRIEPRTEPIWLEKATVIGGFEDPEHQATMTRKFGLEMPIFLER